MRVGAAILIVVSVGGSAALAQGDVRADYGPLTQAKAETKTEAKAPAKTSAKSEAKPQPKAKSSSNSSAKSSKSEAKSHAKPATTGSAPPNAPAPKPSGLQDSYASMPRADRVTLQDDLTWGGDFTGPIDGEFSERLVTAVKAYQARHKNPATGLLTADERAALATAVAPRKAAVGWRLADDSVSGARVGIPGRFATKTTVLQNGTRWSSEQGQLQIETFRIDTGASLEAVFDQQKKLPRRHLASSALQADSFVITGMQGLKKMVVRGYSRNGEVRGITILYDQAMEGSIDPLVAPISSAFVPFPSAYVTAGAVGTAQRKVEYGTGVFVSAVGHILTDRRLVDDCKVIAIPGLGNAERVATDASGELALLRLYGARNLKPIGMIGGGTAAPAAPMAVTLIGVADPTAQGGGNRPSALHGSIGPSQALDTAPGPGFTGSAVLDPQGRFAGLVVTKASVVAGPNVAPRAAVVTAERIRNFLEANYVAPASGEAGAEAAKASVTRVICVRP